MSEPSNVVVRDESQTAVTPMQMLSMAVARGTDMDQLTKLMDLQERWEKNEARKAFHVSFSAFKAESIDIIRNKPIDAGPLKGKKYADLFAVVDAITPALSAHNLSASWKLTKDDKDWLEVTCTITHSLGHSESVSMGAAPDIGGAKNGIQARASTVTYLQRYTMLSATGLAAKDSDNDGNGDGITAERRLQIVELVKTMRAHIVNGAVDDAVLEGENFGLDGPDEWKLAWSHFDSKERSAMKRANEAMRAAKAKQPITEAQVRRLEAMISERKLDREVFKKIIYDDFAKEHFADLSPFEYDKVCAEVEATGTVAQRADEEQRLPKEGAGPVAATAPTESPGSAGEIAARLEAQKAFDNASRAIKDRYCEMDGKPISQLSMKGAIRAAAWLKSEIDKESSTREKTT